MCFNRLLALGRNARAVYQKGKANTCILLDCLLEFLYRLLQVDPKDFNGYTGAVEFNEEGRRSNIDIKLIELNKEQFIEVSLYFIMVGCWCDEMQECNNVKQNDSIRSKY